MATTPHYNRMKSFDASLFYDDRGELYPHMKHDHAFRQVIYNFLPPSSTVLQLGGQYGINAILVNRLLNDPTLHTLVIAESCPDSSKNSITPLLDGVEKNRQLTHAQFNIHPWMINSSVLLNTQSLLSLVSSHCYSCLVVDPSFPQEAWCHLFPSLVFDLLKNHVQLLIMSRIHLYENELNVDEVLNQLGYICVAENQDHFVFLHNGRSTLPFTIMNTPTVSYGKVGLFGKRGLHHLHYKDQLETTDCAIEQLDQFLLSQSFFPKTSQQQHDKFTFPLTKSNSNLDEVDTLESTASSNHNIDKTYSLAQPLASSYWTIGMHANAKIHIYLPSSKTRHHDHDSQQQAQEETVLYVIGFLNEDLPCDNVFENTFRFKCNNKLFYTLSFPKGTTNTLKNISLINTCLQALPLTAGHVYQFEIEADRSDWAHTGLLFFYAQPSQMKLWKDQHATL